MAALNEIKDIILGMMESVCQAPDINATQQMGVNLTNAVKREGVVIIQNQNVEVLGRLMPQMIKALRICDSISEIDITPTALLPPSIEVDVDPIEECCRWMFERKTRWQDMQDILKERYLEYVVSKHKTKTEAAKMLGVGATYLCKLTKPKEEAQ